MRSRFVAATLVAAVALGACGGSNKVSAKDYATKVCGAEKSWQNTIQSSSAGLSAALGPSSSPTTGKQKLGDFFDTVTAATGTLIGQLQDAGVPDVNNGQQVSDALITAMKTFKAALEKSRDQAAKLPTDDPQAFAQGAQQLSQSLTGSLDSASAALQKVDAPELERAGNSVPACQSLKSTPSP